MSKNSLFFCNRITNLGSFTLPISKKQVNAWQESKADQHLRGSQKLSLKDICSGAHSLSNISSYS